MLILNRLTGERIYVGARSITVQDITDTGARIRVCEYERAYSVTVAFGHGVKIGRHVYVTVLRGRRSICWPNVRIGIQAPKNAPIESDDIKKRKRAA